MDTKHKTVVSLEKWRKMKGGRVPGLGRPRLSANLLDILLSISVYDYEISDHRDSQAVITCDPLSWLEELPIWPESFLNMRSVFGRPEIKPPAPEDIEDDPELCSLWSCFEAFVIDCLTVESAINYIAQEQLPPLMHVDFSEGETIVSTRKSEMIDSVLIDYSLPLSGRGGVFEKLLFDMPGRLSTIKALQSQVGLMTSLLIVSKCPALRELVVYLPTGSLFQEALAPCRRFLRDRLNLAAIIELPSGALQPSVNISCAVAIFQKNAVHTETLFYSPSGVGDLVQVRTQPWLIDLQSSLSGVEPRYGFLAQVDAEGVWTSHRNLPKAHGIPKGLMEFSEVKRIGDLFDIYSGIRFPRQIADGKEGQPVIRGRDIGKNPTTENLERFVFKAAIPDRVRAQSGDILLQKIGATPESTVVQDDLAGAIVGDTVLILRPRSPSVRSQSILQALSSSAGKRLLTNVAKGAFAPTVSIDRLRHLEIPILAEEVQRQITAAEKTEDDLRQRADRLAAIRESIFVAESKDEFERNLISVQTATTVVSSSLAASDEANYRIRNFYPFPLAFPYRLLDGIVDPAILYKEQLRIAENLLGFLASVTLALIEDDLLKSQLDISKAFRGGISPGTWHELATNGAGLLTESKAGRLATALKSLWKRGNRETKFFATVRQLIQTKNAFKHDKEVLLTVGEYSNGCARLSEILKSCMEELEFFIQFPICLVTNLNIDRRTNLCRVDVLRYMGDHPGLQQQKIRYAKPLPKNTLFIDVEDGRLESLFPFVTVQHCSTCRFRETYFVDGWDGKQARLKSFERGHTEQNVEVDTDLTTHFQN